MFVTNSQKVYLVDDDASHLKAIARLLRLSGFEVAAYGSAADFLADLDPDFSGCVLTDLRMPEIDGTQLQTLLTERESTLPVLFLTGHGDIPTSVQVMRKGAEDFLTKDTPKNKLTEAINRAFSRNLRQRDEQVLANALRDSFALLSPREREVLRYVVEGKKNKQIAGFLGIHERTVKFHRTAVTTKLRVSSAAELAVICMQMRELGLDF